MRRPIHLTLIVLLTSLSVWWMVGAQEDDGNSLEAQLPITENVRYVVGTGDTLDTLGAAFDVNVDCLRESNGLTSSTIYIGQELGISVECPPYVGLNYVPFPRTVLPAEQGGGEVPIYVVQASDTLSDIALAYDISLESLQEYNNLDNPNSLVIGQVIEIPPNAPEYGRVPPLDGQVLEQGGADGDIIYVIQPRDTLDVVGAFYNAEPNCIAEANGITQPSAIQPRTTILIPSVCAPYVGPNVAGGMIIPMGDEPTVAPTVAITATMRPTLVPTATFPVIEATPTAENIIETLEGVSEQGGVGDESALVTEEPTAEVVEMTPTFTPMPMEELATEEPTAEVIEATEEPTAEVIEATPTFTPTVKVTEEPTAEVVEATPTMEAATAATGTGNGEISGFFGSLGSSLNDAD